MRIAVVVAVVLVAAAVPLAAQDGAYAVVAVKDGGSVAGRVLFSGKVPAPEILPVISDRDACGEDKPSRALVVAADGGVENAVIKLVGIRRGKGWGEREYALGQTDCRFEPHVLLLPKGADLRLLNHDRIAHNVRTYGRGPVFNVGQPKFVEKLLVENFSEQVSHPEVVRVGCDIHPWMSAYIVVMEHPYYAVTDERGAFRLAEVPPGEYHLALWHETLGESSRKIAVRPGEETEVTFRLSRPRPAAGGR